MRFVWTVAGDDPDFDQGDKYGINGYFYPMGDSLTTPERLRDTAKYGGGRIIGTYMGHGWYPGFSPAQLAAVADSEWKRLTLNNTINKGLRVMFNLEQHDPDFIAETLEAWRALRPTVGTSWSPEGMQGGWMSPEFVARVVAARTRVVPQAFLGNMTRRESDQVLRDVLNRGFPASIVSIFYDAAQLGADWDGYAFTMGRLPWIP